MSRGYSIMKDVRWLFLFTLGIAVLASPCSCYAESSEEDVSLSALMRELQDGHVNISSIRARLPQMIEEFGAATYDDASQELSHEQYQAIFYPKQHSKRLATSSQDVSVETYQGVQGRPGVDFPVLQAIPKTGFSCKNVKSSGYYADLETDCQVFHICAEGRKISFLCPNGTIFRQSHLICDWWWTVDCASSREYYEESAEQLANDQRIYTARARAQKQQQQQLQQQQQNRKQQVRAKSHQNSNINTATQNFEIPIPPKTEVRKPVPLNNIPQNKFAQNTIPALHQNNAFFPVHSSVSSEELINQSPEFSGNYQFSGEHILTVPGQQLSQAQNQQVSNNAGRFVNRREKQRERNNNGTHFSTQNRPATSTKYFQTQEEVFNPEFAPPASPTQNIPPRSQSRRKPAQQQHQQQTQTQNLKARNEGQNRNGKQYGENQQSAETASFVSNRGKNNLIYNTVTTTSQENIPNKAAESSKDGRNFRFTTTPIPSTLGPQFKSGITKSVHSENPSPFNQKTEEINHSQVSEELSSEEYFVNDFFTTQKPKVFINNNYDIFGGNQFTGGESFETTYNTGFQIQTEPNFVSKQNNNFLHEIPQVSQTYNSERESEPNVEQTTESSHGLKKESFEYQRFENNASNSNYKNLRSQNENDFSYNRPQYENTNNFQFPLSETIDSTSPRFKAHINTNRETTVLPHTAQFDEIRNFQATRAKTDDTYTPQTTFYTGDPIRNSLTERPFTYNELKEERDPSPFKENNIKTERLQPFDYTTAFPTIQTEQINTENVEAAYPTDGTFIFTSKPDTNVRNRTKVLAYSSINLSQTRDRSESGRSLRINDEKEQLIVSSSSGIRNSDRNQILSSGKQSGGGKYINNLSITFNKSDSGSYEDSRDRSELYTDITIEPEVRSQLYTTPLAADTTTQIPSDSEKAHPMKNRKQPKNLNVVIIQQTSIIKDSSETSGSQESTPKSREGRKYPDAGNQNDFEIEKQRIDFVSMAPTTGRRRYKPTTPVPPKQTEKLPTTETLTSKIPQLIHLTRDLLPPLFDEPYKTSTPPEDTNILSHGENNEVFSGNRIGLNIPPSSGPGALHSLSVYFATENETVSTTPINAVSQVDEIISDFVKHDTRNSSNQGEALQSSESASISPLLTDLTRNSYNDLFRNNIQEQSQLQSSQKDTSDTVPISTTTRSNSLSPLSSTDIVRNEIRAKEIESTLKELEENFDNVISGYSTTKPKATSASSSEQDLLSKDAPNLRALAQVFSKALAAYLDNPEEFRKALSDLRPSEPDNAEQNTLRPSTYSSSTYKINTEYPSVTKEEEEVLDFSDVTPSNGYRKNSSRSRKPGNNQNDLGTSNSVRFYGNIGGQAVHTTEINPASLPKQTTFYYPVPITKSPFETLQNSQSQYFRNNAVFFSSQTTEQNTEDYSVPDSQWSDGSDYTLPPGTIQYKGPGYGPNTIDTSSVTTTGAYEDDRFKYGGFQNNSVAYTDDNNRHGGFVNNIDNDLPSTIRTTTETTKLGSVPTTQIKEFIAATTFSPVVKYKSESDTYPPPTALVPPNSNESPWAQQVNKEVVIDEILGPFIPQDLNNLAEGLINLPTASGEDRSDTTETLYLSTPVTQEAYKNNQETTTSRQRNSNKPRKSGNSQVIRIFVETDADSGSLKLSTSSRKIDSRDDESLIVAPSSGFGSSILNQLSAVRKSDVSNTTKESREKLGSDSLNYHNSENKFFPVSTTTASISTRMAFSESQSFSRMNVTNSPRRQKERPKTTTQFEEFTTSTSQELTTTEVPQTTRNTKQQVPQRNNKDTTTTQRTQKVKASDLHNFGQRILTTEDVTPVKPTTIRPSHGNNKIKSENQKHGSTNVNLQTNGNVEKDSQQNTNYTQRPELTSAETQVRIATSQSLSTRQSKTTNNNSKSFVSQKNEPTESRSKSKSSTLPSPTTIRPIGRNNLTTSTTQPRRTKSSRRKTTSSSNNHSTTTKTPPAYLPTTIKRSRTDVPTTIPPSTVPKSVSTRRSSNVNISVRQSKSENNPSDSRFISNQPSVETSGKGSSTRSNKNHAEPEEMKTLETLLMSAARKGQMGLNDTSATALINVMRDAATNSTVRRLFLFLVNDSMKNNSLHQTRSHLVDALLQLPIEVIDTSTQSSPIQRDEQKHTNKDSPKTHPKTSVDDSRPISRQREIYPGNNSTPAPSNTSAADIHLGQSSNRHVVSDSASNFPKQDGSKDKSDTFASEGKEIFAGKDHGSKGSRRKSVEEIVTAPVPTTTRIVTSETLSKNTHKKADSSRQPSRKSENQTPSPKPSDDSNEDSDSRAIDLLRSLYSLASKWG